MGRETDEIAVGISRVSRDKELQCNASKIPGKSTVIKRMNLGSGLASF